ncbi:hypothetical protein TSTA_016450 [Talaromyces stipitatus ATCC 10500]|uniref:Uncharacterized protein n=1 Tax=Talaromyces stipitatus (strain ATCC 10500 / CBS 375.48 / QM 6759 / NRRL 1006) TaxID=441959 RepID=B8MEE0_TALSN|nr:uncharacterized protein TSTA_016450 [Talaromyces stipitatus ATCC 10500]EED16567.1 hypothetical protein TSTA_016450 [Talaromyces stipitatus ATCC 10500]
MLGSNLVPIIMKYLKSRNRQISTQPRRVIDHIYYLQEAYSTLIDSIKRRNYDAYYAPTTSSRTANASKMDQAEIRQWHIQLQNLKKANIAREKAREEQERRRKESDEILRETINRVRKEKDEFGEYMHQVFEEMREAQAQKPSQQAEKERTKKDSHAKIRAENKQKFRTTHW